MINLSEASFSTIYKIAEIHESDLKHRLYEMGIYPNQFIELVRKAPLGDPLIAKVNAQMIMLRLSEARLILLDKKTNS